MTEPPGMNSAGVLAVLPFAISLWRLADPRDDDSLLLLGANPAASAMSGFSLEGRAGERMIDLYPDGTLETRRLLAQVCRGGVARTLPPIRYKTPAGLEQTLAVSGLPGPAGTVVVVAENQSALRAAEEESRSLSRFLDSLIEALPAMLFVKDAKDLRFQRFNKAGEELLGIDRSAMLGKTDHDFFPPGQAEFFRAKDRLVLAGKTLEDIPEEPIETPRGVRWLHTRKMPVLDEDGTPRHLLGVSIDITQRRAAEEALRASHLELEERVRARTSELQKEVEERRRAQESLAATEGALRQAQKLEAIGRLAGGVAHDFNNLLTVILGCCETMLAELPPEAPGRALAEEIARAGSRAAGLTRQLLAFGRRQVLRPRVIELAAVVGGLEGMLRRLLGEEVSLEVHAARPQSRIAADPTQIEQVVVNLAVNGRDAMPGGGRLTIRTGDFEADPVWCATHPGAKPGPGVLLEVEDTGIGMDAATKERIFEPFFTTKPMGVGTGLGLSMVLGVVEQSGGSISVVSEPGKGTVFRMLFPAAKPATPPSAPPPRADSPRGGHETILLLEDDPQVRFTVRTMLQGLGYRVVEAERGDDALALAAGSPEPFRLLLTDVVMPDKGGERVAEELRKIAPGIRVVFMSGYPDEALGRHGILDSDVTFLPKPLSRESLARTLREVLDRPPRRSGDGPETGS